MASQHDIYLNGVGYQLVKGADGKLLAGAIREQRRDPFANYAGEEERWATQDFYFDEGAGLALFDGSHRYRRGISLDTRSRRMLRPIKFNFRQGVNNTHLHVDSSDVPVALTISNLGGYVDGYALRFQAQAGHTHIRSTGILVRHMGGYDYTGGSTFRVEIWSDTAGPPPTPNAVVAGASATPDVRAEDDPWWPFEDRWKNGDWFWLNCHFAAAVAVTAGNYYWLVVINDAQAHPVQWGIHPTTGAPTPTCSAWDGATWSNGAAANAPYHKVRYYDEIDSHVYDFQQFRGTDEIERLYACVGPKVMYYDTTTSKMLNGKGDFTAPVRQLLEFNSMLFAAQGIGADMWYTTGASATTVWTQVTNERAVAFAIHDNLIWKAGGTSPGAIGAHIVVGSATGSAWGALAVAVGDPGTPITALASHGGKLYAAKPEGVYEINYPETYPGGGSPASNLVIDFSTDKLSRAFLLDWHTALYIPGSGGLMEWKSGLIRDAWSERSDLLALTAMQTEQGMGFFPTYGDRRRWAPIAEGDPGTFWGAVGLVRGAIFTYASPFMTSGGTIWWFDGRNWHPIATDWENYGEPHLALYLESRGGGRGRLWVGAGYNVAYGEYPTWTNDRTLDDDSEYDETETAYLELATFDGGKPHTLKDFYKVGVQFKNSGVNPGLVDVYYAIDTEFEKAKIATHLGQVTVEPYQELVLPANTAGYYIRLALTALGGSTSDTVEVESVSLFYQLLPETIVSHQLTVLATSGAQRHSGTWDQRSAGAIQAALNALLEETEPFAYVDPLGESHCVRAVGISTDYLRSQEGVSDIGSGWKVEARITLTLLEVAPTCPA